MEILFPGFKVIDRGFVNLGVNDSTPHVIDIPNIDDYIIIQSCASGSYENYLLEASRALYAAVSFTGSAELTNETTITFRTNNVALASGGGTTREVDCRIDWALVKIR